MSSLRVIYEAYLKKPNAAALSDTATLNYITTLTTINTSAAIIRHNAAHQKALQKKEETVLSCIEGSDAVCMDIETTLEFITGGGAYLPGLDDNFLSDRIVTFPMVHIVHFDSDQKIQQIRLYWDQGSLLKLVDVIGSRAKNWPIRDGKDQARLIASSAAGMPQTAGSSGPNVHDPINAKITGKPRSQSKNVTGDPHASLSLFAPREEDDENTVPAAIAPRAAASAKPPPRDYHELFPGNDSDASPQTKGRAASPTKENAGIRAAKAQSAKPAPRDYHDLFVGEDSDASPVSKERSSSPRKENMTPAPIAPKGGAGKNYQPSRLFDTENSLPGTPSTPTQSPEKFRKPDPKKYSHFTFGHGDENGPQQVPVRPKSKHQQNWNFEDFATPEPSKNKVRGSDVRHFGWEDDEPVMDSPNKHPAVAKARPDAKTNFEFQDDGTPAGDRRPAGHPRGAGNIRPGNNMYTNNVIDEGDHPPSPEKKGRPLSSITNLKDRRKDFDPHFSLTDESPPSNENKQTVPENRAKVVSQMGAQWEATDTSPGPRPSSKDSDRINPILGDKENYRNGGNSNQVGIKSGGDGMGGKKGSGRSWGFGDDSDEDGAGQKNGGKFQPSKIQQAPKDSGFWDF
ncbi:hypothetical protein P7C71_g1505, partial [Lecanoromycetidae sp. Uapishka_2]